VAFVPLQSVKGRNLEVCILEHAQFHHDLLLRLLSLCLLALLSQDNKYLVNGHLPVTNEPAAHFCQYVLTTRNLFGLARNIDTCCPYYSKRTSATSFRKLPAVGGRFQRFVSTAGLIASFYLVGMGLWHRLPGISFVSTAGSSKKKKNERETERSVDAVGGALVLTIPAVAPLRDASFSAWSLNLAVCMRRS
jgi:hypothetical protein